MSFKKINAWLHLWLGIASGLVIVVLGITGCVLVFEQEIRNWTSPWLHAEKAAGRALLPPSKLHQAVTEAYPGMAIRSVWYHGEGRAAHVSIDADSLVYVDPYTAKVAAIVDNEDFFHFIEDGHFYLWLPPDIGHQVIGWSTFVFFLLLISGIILWWPKKWNKRGQQQSFTIKWKATFKRLNYDLHNVLGFYTLLVSLLLAITGLVMSFSWFSNTVFWLAGEKAPAVRQRALSDTLHAPATSMFVQVDKAWNKAITQIGERNRDQVIVSFPRNTSDAIYVCTDMYNGSWRDVYLDQHTLDILPASQARLRDLDFAAWLRRSNYGLHVGAVGGLTTQIMYFIASLVCASLPITGFYIWWGRKKKTSRKIARPQPPKELP